MLYCSKYKFCVAIFKHVICDQYLTSIMLCIVVLAPKCRDIVLGARVYVCMSSRAHGRKCAHVEIKKIKKHGRK